jgi:hypothetical protein
VSKDITPIIDGWEFEPERTSVRIVRGTDGREKIQLRLDLGLLQMELDGRPDGQRPEGHESWLEYYQAQQRAHDAANPDAAPFRLSDTDCGRLLREAVQYYHRYLSFWHLGRYELFAFVKEFARRERDRLQFDQWRPYVIMMHARAVATPLVELNDVPTALQAIDAGITAIKTFLEEYQQGDRAGQCAELVSLEKWREELGGGQATPPSPEEPLDRMAELRAQLDQAVAEERFEDAAALRDEIRRATEEA